MGKTIETLAKEAGHDIVFIKDKEVLKGEIIDADVVIEFSIPEAAVSNIRECLENNIAVVSGTTGWMEHFPEMVKFCEERNGSLIYASNFSIGVNLFFSLNEKLAQLMNNWPEYKATMTETHHIHKKDAPSGTAISLAEGIIGNSSYKDWSLTADDDDTIHIDAVREGEVKGTHKITFASAIDEISIEHKAHSREGFAKGAILAAEWLKGKHGVYTMRDVLGLSDING